MKRILITIILSVLIVGCMVVGCSSNRTIVEEQMAVCMMFCYGEDSINSMQVNSENEVRCECGTGVTSIWISTEKAGEYLSGK